MMVPHQPWLVALSVAIAIQGSFVGLSLAEGLDRWEGYRRRLALAGAAITLATGVWSMHFVGMLAADFPSAIDYLVLPTLLSFLICVLVVGAGVYAAHAPGNAALRIGGGAVGMGLGVCAMHYEGISAIHLAGPTTQEPAFVVASVAVSIAASALALWVLDAPPTRSRLFLAATGLGLAISGMHYTAMAGMRLDPLCYDVSHFVEAASALSRNTLALLATLVAFGVSGAFLLSLVPDRAGSGSPTSIAIGPTSADVGASAPHGEATLASVELAPPAKANVLRVEKDGRAHEIACDAIFAVRADAHYTHIHDGEQEYFCTLSISAVEARLDPKLFQRVHRSHILAVHRIAKVKRAGESHVAELGVPVRCSIPIARAHVRQLRQQIGAFVV
jgi:diguanylate cyclase